MTDTPEALCRPRWGKTLWGFVALGSSGMLPAGAVVGLTGELVWLIPALLCTLVTWSALYRATTRVRADHIGLSSRTLLRRRSARWSEVAELRLQVTYTYLKRSSGEESRHVSVLLRDGRRWDLSLPRSWAPRTEECDATLDRLRALHRRYGAVAVQRTEPATLTVIRGRTTGSRRLGSLVACVLLLVGGVVAVQGVPAAAAYVQAWESAVPCSPGTPTADRGDCLRTVHAVIERTEAQPGERHSSYLYFTDDRPTDRRMVSRNAADSFRAGDRVRLTVWHGTVMEVEGDRHVWREHIRGAGDFAALAAGLTLGAGFAAARFLIRFRHRNRPDGEILPSALPFGAAFGVTALWLLPLSYLHPMAPFASPATTTWASLGTTVTLTLLVWAWRATRAQVPEAPATRPAVRSDEEVFLPARFLDATDYNPHRFGTHLVMGGGEPLAVVPHSGPGRFAAHPVPVSRLLLVRVRRAAGGDAKTVPSDWHVAELDDAGTLVRLAASPADLTRILRELPASGVTAAPGTGAAVR